MIMMGLLPSVLELADLQVVLAGHGYDLGGGTGREPSGDDGGGGITARWIVAVLILALVTLGLLVSLDPSGARARLRRVAPKAVILLVVAAPLIAWTAFSGGEAKSLMVERWIGVSGTPELLISLGEEDLNTVETTDGRRAVRVECVDREGQVILDSEQEWPFVKEAGYEYPHAHQEATREALQRADRCRLRGTRVRLEAEVEGALTR